ncbi:glycosyltransferase [Sphingomonas lenta]|uniref:Glycosyltransferase n=1 Tax=Sphingomonas lenta TaxID=1141887 RepID=A0A2A2SBD2_9SPHN|nr:glycosyltransferase [Sphingomonas lenta]PAX06331.1 glycosyltransferase [Sphingomonas lenta]
MRRGGAVTRVRFLLNSLAGGGAERVMLTLLSASRPRMADAPFALALLDDDPDAYRAPDWLPVARLRTGGSLARGLARVLALVRRERPALIVSFLTRANIIAVAAARLTGRRVVISERVNTSAHLSGNRLARLLVRAAYRHADRVVAVSGGVADDLAANYGVRRERIVTIANPVDIDAIVARGREPAKLPVATPFIAAMGRLTETKNMGLLVEAYAESGVDMPLVILGEGPEREALEARVAALGFGGRVHLLGFRPNPFAVLARAALYVSASNGEGFPNALVEAMALGVPVLATNCASGPSEILADRPRHEVRGTLATDWGTLVPVDDRQALAAALRDAEASPERLAAQGEAGRRRAQEFGVARAVERYWATFDAVLR